MRQVSAVLQAIADTTGHVDLRPVRALMRRFDAAYAAAHAALATLEPAVDEPMPGCTLRRVIVLPYRVRAR